MQDRPEWRHNPRVSRKDLPNIPTPCEREKCPHNSDGKCPNPRIMKQMEDAKCKNVGNKNLLASFSMGD